jgi:hypothetical protein
MCILGLVLSVAVFLIGCLSVYTCIKVHNLSNLLNEVDNELSDVSSELTQHETHTRGALTGSYFMLKELTKKFDSHCHSYSFENGVLYIQDPIINETSDGETDTDNGNSNQEEL